MSNTQIRAASVPESLMKTKTQVFVQGPLTCIDEVNPATGRGAYSGETLEQVRLRYPGAEIADLDPWYEAKEKALCTEPVEVTEERFMEMLEVLPPQRWQRGTTESGRCESFEISEHLSGRVTSIFVFLGGRYYEFAGIAGQKLEAHIAHCTPELNRVAVALALVMQKGKVAA